MEEGASPSQIKTDGEWYVRYIDDAFLRSLIAEGGSTKDTPRAYFRPIKTEDSRLDFYTMYKREANEYDTDYVKKYHEDLSITLVFVRPSLSLSPII
jgi:hypothetical protein